MLIIHIPNGDVYNPSVYRDEIKQGNHVTAELACYTCGFFPPNYPVPALITKFQPTKTGFGLAERQRDGLGWFWIMVCIR